MRRRLILTYFAITIFVLVVLEVPFGILLVNRQWDQITVGLERDAMVLGSVYEDALHLGASYTPRVAEEYASRTGTRVVITDENGVSIVDTAGVVNRDFSGRPEIQVALGGERTVGRRPSETLGHELIYVAVPVASGGVVHGTVRLTLNGTFYDSAVRQVWGGLSAVAVLILLGVSLTGMVLADGTVRPLRHLAEAVRRFRAAGVPIDPVELKQAPPEVVELADTFAEMGARVSEVMERQRRFVADASHQLRSPLTSIRLRLENLAETADHPESFEPVLGEVDRLSTLVSQLLRLARAEQGQGETERVDLAEAVAARCHLWEAVAMEAGVDLVGEGGEDPIEVVVAGGAIDQILDNLLDNAIAVTPPGCKVRVWLETGPEMAMLHVTDQGPGMTPEERAKAFDRFWRGPHNTGTSGLGLAIVAELVAGCDGVVRLDAPVEGGIDAVIGFPWPGQDRRSAGR